MNDVISSLNESTNSLGQLLKKNIDRLLNEKRELEARLKQADGEYHTLSVKLDKGRRLLREAEADAARLRQQATDRRERLAAYAHDAWAGWMRYMFSKCVDHDGESVIPQWAVERWTRQMMTAYQDLPEGEKESDRAEADKILAIAAPDEQPAESEAKDESQTNERAAIYAD